MPNPYVRELTKSERPSYIHGQNSEATTISVCQVLFKGAGDDLFMFFNQSQVDEKNLKPNE